MLRRLLDESAGHFWWPEEFENVANPYFDNLKHFQNPGHLLLTKSSKLSYCDNIGTDYANKTITKTDHNTDQQPMDAVLETIKQH